MLSPWFQLCAVGPTEKFRARILNAGGHISISSFISCIALLCIARTFVNCLSTEMSFVCDSCPKAFNSLDALHHHRSHHHSKLPEFVTDGKMLNIHTVDDKYTCPLEGCKKAYCNRESMLRHLKGVHGVLLATPPTPSADVADGNANIMSEEGGERLFIFWKNLDQLNLSS